MIFTFFFSTHSNCYTKMYIPILLLSFLVHLTTANDCVHRSERYGIVCVCNATFCDTLPTVPQLNNGEYVLFSSNEAGLRFEVTNGTITDGIVSGTITISSKLTYQEILGFGGAFTDAAGINILSLPEEAQEKLLRAYFSEDGSEYSIGRVPIGGTDFSRRGYSYADDEEGSLDGFALQDEDYLYKIPFIQQANNLTEGKLLLYSSLWSSPTWMKEGGKWTGSFLKTEYYQMLADYFVKFFEAYQAEGINFWGTTVQNEPLAGFLVGEINNIIWLPDRYINWLKSNLGPTLRNSSFSDLKIIIHDDARTLLPDLLIYYDDDEALEYIDGVGVHWYEDFITPAEFLDLVHTDKKDIFLLYTEACPGYFPIIDTHVKLGDWDRGTDYASNIIDVLNHGGVGWTDWNLALNSVGGPTYILNFVDSPIIVDAYYEEFYKQPMYYALAHFSKFLPRGSKRVKLDVDFVSSLEGLKATAFIRPDGYVAVVIENRQSSNRRVTVVNENNHVITVTVTGRSINTLVYADD